MWLVFGVQSSCRVTVCSCAGALLASQGLAGADAPLPPGAQDLLDRRAAARTARDFATSDALRDELAAMGVEVRDTPDGQTVRQAKLSH